MVIADKMLLYNFENDSPFRGSVEFNQILGDDDDDGVSRRIIIVFVRENGNLNPVSPHGYIIYLGGDHSEKNSGKFVEGSLQIAFKESKYFRVRSQAVGMRDAVNIASLLETRGEFGRKYIMWPSACCRTGTTCTGILMLHHVKDGK